MSPHLLHKIYIRRLLVCLSIVTLAATACSSPVTTSASSAPSQPTIVDELTPAPTFAPGVEDLIPPSERQNESEVDEPDYVIADFGEDPFLNEYVSRSDAGLLIEVEAISEPLWNSQNGRPWNDQASPYAALEYRDAQFRVHEVLFIGQEAQQVQPNDLLTVRLYGSGTSVANDADDLNLVSGPVALGTMLVVLLQEAEFPTQLGLVQVLRLTGHRNTNWTVSNGVAIRHGRDGVPIEQLTVALQEEHRNGPEIAPASAAIDQRIPPESVPPG